MAVHAADRRSWWRCSSSVERLRVVAGRDLPAGRRAGPAAPAAARLPELRRARTLHHAADTRRPGGAADLRRRLRARDAARLGRLAVAAADRCPAPAPAVGTALSRCWSRGRRPARRAPRHPRSPVPVHLPAVERLQPRPAELLDAVALRRRRQRALRLLAGVARRVPGPSDRRPRRGQLRQLLLDPPPHRRGAELDRTASSCGCWPRPASSASSCSRRSWSAALRLAMRARRRGDAAGPRRGRHRAVAAGRVADPRIAGLVLGDARAVGPGPGVPGRGGGARAARPAGDRAVPGPARRRGGASRLPRPASGAVALLAARRARASRICRCARSRWPSNVRATDPAAALATCERAADLNPLSSEPGRMAGCDRPADTASTPSPSSVPAGDRPRARRVVRLARRGPGRLRAGPPPAGSPTTSRSPYSIDSRQPAVEPGAARASTPRIR